MGGRNKGKKMASGTAIAGKRVCVRGRTKKEQFQSLGINIKCYLREKGKKNDGRERTGREGEVYQFQQQP